MELHTELLVLQILVWNSLINGQSQQNCPSSLPRNTYLKTHNGICYQFITVEKSWNDAQSDCQHRRGNMVEVRNSGVQNFLVTSLRSLGWKTKGVWIGLTDRDKEGTWKWATGDAVSWTNWDHDQGPHHGFLFSSAGLEDCAQIRLDHQGKWHDAVCNGFISLLHYSYICQYNPVPSKSGTTARPLVHRTTSRQRTTHRITSTPNVAKHTTAYRRTTSSLRRQSTPNVVKHTTARLKLTSAPRKPSTPNVVRHTTARLKLTSTPRRQSTPKVMKYTTAYHRIHTTAQPGQNKGTYSVRVSHASNTVFRVPTPFVPVASGIQQHKSKSHSHSNSDTNTIIGAVVGTVFGVALIAVVVILAIRRRRNDSMTHTSLANPLYGETPNTTAQQIQY